MVVKLLPLTGVLSAVVLLYAEQSLVVTGASYLIHFTSKMFGKSNYLIKYLTARHISAMKMHLHIKKGN